MTIMTIIRRTETYRHDRHAGAPPVLTGARGIAPDKFAKD
jgi:hypothetical protein